MAIEYKTLTYRTAEGNDNATYCWVELSASHIPSVNGLIKQVVIQGGTTNASGMTTSPMYLGIWERQPDGGLIALGVSKNSVVQQLNTPSAWEFDGASVRGRALLLALLSSPDEHWTNNTHLLLRSTVQTNDTDGCVILTDIGRINVIPDITFTVEYPVYVPDDEPEPAPEPEVELREIDIRNYMPPVVRDTDEFQQIAAAENPEFNELQKCIMQILQDAFVQDATPNGVRRWEANLGITPAVGDTLAARKERILTYLSIKLPYTWRVLEQMLTEYIGDTFVMEYRNDYGQLILHTDLISDDKVQTINELLERVLPENIEVLHYNSKEVTENE